MLKLLTCAYTSPWGSEEWKTFEYAYDQAWNSPGMFKTLVRNTKVLARTFEGPKHQKRMNPTDAELLSARFMTDSLLRMIGRQKGAHRRR
jgi:hypothetical protein